MHLSVLELRNDLKRNMQLLSHPFKIEVKRSQIWINLESVLMF